MTDGLFDVPGARLALGPDHGGAFRDAAQGLAQVGGAAHERDRERPLVDVVDLVRRREHLALVDIVDTEGLQHLGLGEMTDARLGHDRDGDRVLDGLDEGGVAHASHAAVPADVGRYPLQGHHSDGPGVLGDLACSAVTTSMITPPRSISAKPPLDQVSAGATALEGEVPHVGGSHA